MARFSILVEGNRYGGECSAATNGMLFGEYVVSTILSKEARTKKIDRMPAEESGMFEGTNVRGWIPFSYFEENVPGEKIIGNVYKAIRNGTITKDNCAAKNNFDSTDWDYIMSHYEEYRDINNGIFKDNGPCKKVDEASKKLLETEAEPVTAASSTPVLSQNDNSNKPHHNTTAPTITPVVTQCNNSVVNRTNDGEFEIDLSKVGDKPVINTDVLANAIAEQYNQTPPQMVNLHPVQVTNEVPQQVNVNPPKTQRSKKDLREGAVNPTIVAPPVQATAVEPILDCTDELIKNYPCLGELRIWITNEFDVAMVGTNGLVEVTVFDKTTHKVIPHMCMVVDVNGNIVSPGIKFWGTSDVQDEHPDFVRAIKMTRENVLAFLTGRQNVTEDMYNYSQSICELNRCLNCRSVWNAAEATGINISDEEANAVFAKAKTELEKIKTNIGTRRVIVKSYKDKDHFVLETAANAPQYLYGPTSNPNKDVLAITVSGKKTTISGK